VRRPLDPSTASIRTRLNRLVVLCLLPMFGWGAILILADPSWVSTLHLPVSAVTSAALWWWLLVSALMLIGGLAYAEHLAAQLTDSVTHLAEAAALLADGQPVETAPLPIKESEAVSEALARASLLMRERTAERDRAAGAERRLRRDYCALESLTTHDALTGVFNRARFDTLLAERVDECQRGACHLTVLYIDVDGFKQINDTHGHAVGDELLRLFAARLKASLRETEVVARLGGDEFAVLIDPASPGGAVKTADGLIDRLSRPYRIGDVVLEVSASIGIASCPSAGTSAPALLDAADRAMYRAKRDGKRRHVTSGFTPL
jgi:diguanylate cyclase (GGDEF)-like protein